jgi:hypothetical protein
MFYYGTKINVKRPGALLIGIGLAVALLTGVSVAMATGTLNFSFRTIGLIAGMVMAGIVLFITVPVFSKAANSTKITGTIIDFETGEVTFRSSSGFRHRQAAYQMIVEYTLNGQKYSGIQIPATSTRKPEVGTPVTLLVSNNNPTDVMTPNMVRLNALITALFLIVSFGFVLIGIFAENGGGETQTIQPGTAEADEYVLMASLVGGGMAALFIIIGLIVSIIRGKKLALQALKTSGVKVACKITDVYVNESVILNGVHPIRITCVEPNGTQRIVKAKGGVGDFNVDGVIDIFVNPLKPEKFYGDIESYRTL